MIKRYDFFKDKHLLFSIMALQILSLYLHFTFLEETFIFIIPTFLFGILGIFEIWFIITCKLDEKRENGSSGR